MIAAGRELAIGEDRKIEIWAIAYTAVFRTPRCWLIPNEPLDIVEVLIAIVKEVSLLAHPAHYPEDFIHFRIFLWPETQSLIERSEVHRF